MAKKWTGNLSATAIFPKSLRFSSENFTDIIKISLIFYLVPGILGAILCMIFGINSISPNSLYTAFSEIKNILSSSSILTLIIWIPLSIFISLIPIWGNLSIVKLINSRLKNDQITWIESIKYAFSKTWTALLLLIVTFVAAIIWAITIVLFITLISIFTLLIGLPIAIVAVIVFSIALLIYLQFVIQSIVDKDLGVFAAIGHSFNIVSGRFWNVLGKIALLKVVCMLFTIGLTMFSLLPFVGVIISTLITLCVTIFQNIVLTIIFNDYTASNVDELEFTL